MKITCHCSACGATYSLGEQYAGKRIKCPKCSAAVQVPAVAAAGPGPSGEANHSPPPRPRAAAGSSPALKSAAGLPPKPGTPPQPPKRSDPAPAAAHGDGIEILGLNEAVSRPSGPGHHHPKKKKAASNTGLWVGIGLGVGGLALVVALVLIVKFGNIFGSSQGPTTAANSSGSPGEKKAPPVATGPLLTLEWAESERAGAKAYIDGEEKEVPPSGPVKYPLPPRRSAYQFRLERPGCEAIVFSRLSAEGQEQLPYPVSWAAKPRDFDNWHQDLDEAKQAAAKENHSLLLVFDRSDNPSGRQFLRDVFWKPEFRDKIGTDYVLTYFDFAESGEAKAKIKDPQRNQRVKDGFNVSVYPTVIVTDKDGLVLGVQEGPVEGGLNTFWEVLEQWRHTGQSIARLKADLAKSPEGEPRQKAVRELMGFFEDHGLDRFCQPQIKEWLAMLPPGSAREKRPVTEAMARVWAERFERVEHDANGVLKLVAAFDQWKKSRTFADADVGAILHFLAAKALYTVQQRAKAAEKCKEGLALNPKDRQLRAGLSAMYAAMTGQRRSEEELAGAGTGFCVAAGDGAIYVLTNHHVIERAKKITLRLHKTDKELPAKIVGDDAEHDMALLKFVLPAGTLLPTVPLAPVGVKQAEEVCALGFPDISLEGSSLIFTRGTVSATPDAKDENGLITVDCKVNPGNSGGPLCSKGGTVVGMVSAKSRISSREDSYGLAIPAERLDSFLAKYLPKTASRAPAEESKRMEWSEVSERLAPSVVYVQNYQ